MVFKKNDIKTKIAAIKGSRKAVLLRKRNKEYRSHFKTLNTDKKHQSDAGKKSRYWEKRKAEELEKIYEKVFQSFQICDRICLMNGELIFIEIKKNKKKILSPLQNEFRKLCKKLGYTYKIVFVE